MMGGIRKSTDTEVGMDREEKNPDMTFSLRLTLYKEDKVFGPGVERLLLGIREKGSLNSACQAMGMSYTKGWRILKNTERQLGFELVKRRTGGSGGGSSELTDRGEHFLEDYRDMCRELEIRAGELFKEYMGKW